MGKKYRVNIPEYCKENIFHYNTAERFPAASYDIYEAEDRDYLFFIIFPKGIFFPPESIIKIPAYEILRLEEVIADIVNIAPDSHSGWACMFGCEEWELDYEYNGISIHRGRDFFEPKWFEKYKIKIFEIFDYYRSEYGGEVICPICSNTFTWGKHINAGKFKEYEYMLKTDYTYLNQATCPACDNVFVLLPGEIHGIRVDDERLVRHAYRNET